MGLLMPNWYTQHILRMPPDQWPAPVMFSIEHVNNDIYTLMQGAERDGRERPARALGCQQAARGNRGADPGDRRALRHDGSEVHGWMAGQVRNGRFLYCTDGSHLCMYDQQPLYMNGVLGFIEDVDWGRFPAKQNGD